MNKGRVYISAAFNQKSVLAITNTLTDYDVVKTHGFKDIEDKKAFAFIIRSKDFVEESLVKNCPNLKAVVSATSGFDHFDLQTVIVHKNIFFGYTPESNAQSAAELTVFHALNFIKKAPSLLKTQIRKDDFIGNELKNKTVFIIGFGRIGKKVAQILKAFECRVIACDPYLNSSVFEAFNVKSVDLNEGLMEADIVSLHCPLTIKTKHLLNKTSLKYLKKEAFVINCARGELIDEMALTRSLEEKNFAGACLDVFESEPLSQSSPLLKLHTVYCTPHAGAFTTEAHTRSALAAAKQVQFILENSDRPGLSASESMGSKQAIGDETSSVLTPLPLNLRWFMDSSPMHIEQC